MARPKTKSTQKDVEPPTARRMRKMAPFIRVVRNAVARNVVSESNPTRDAYINVFHPKGWSKPEGWPIGRIQEKLDNGVVIRYHAERLMIWLYEYKYTNETPSMIYAKRRSEMLMMNELERSLDKLFDDDFEKGYNDVLVDTMANSMDDV